MPRPGRLRHHLPGRRRRAGPAPRRIPRATAPAGGGRGPSPAVACRHRSDGLPPTPVGGRREAAWSRAILPLLEWRGCGCCSPARWSGRTGAASSGCPTARRPRARTREVDLDAPGWAVVGYSRAAALAERAVLPVTFGALDGEARWLDEERQPPSGRTGSPAGSETDAPGAVHRAAHRLRRGAAAPGPRRDARLRAERRAALGLAPGRAGAGPGQAAGGRARPGERAALPRRASAAGCRASGRRRRRSRSRTRAARTRRWPPSGCSRSPPSWSRSPWPMRGWTRPEVAVVAALTHIRSRPWLEQMVARATRVDPDAGPYESSAPWSSTPTTRCSAASASGWRPSRARSPATPSGRRQPALPFPGEAGREGRPGIVPLECNALALRFETLRPGPDFAARRAPEAREARRPTCWSRPRCGSGGCGTASASWWRRRWWRTRRAAPAARAAATPCLQRRAEAGDGQGPGEMTLAELEAALAWLERNRLSDHLHLLEGDARYAFEARQRRGPWQPPQGGRAASAAWRRPGRRGGQGRLPPPAGQPPRATDHGSALNCRAGGCRGAALGRWPGSWYGSVRRPHDPGRDRPEPRARRSPVARAGRVHRRGRRRPRCERPGSARRTPAKAPRLGSGMGRRKALPSEARNGGRCDRRVECGTRPSACRATCPDGRPPNFLSHLCRNEHEWGVETALRTRARLLHRFWQIADGSAVGRQRQDVKPRTPTLFLKTLG